MKLNTSPYPVQLEVVFDRDTFVKKYRKLKGYEPDIEGCKGYTTYSGNKVLMGIFSEPLPTLIHEPIIPPIALGLPEYTIDDFIYISFKCVW